MFQHSLHLEIINICSFFCSSGGFSSFYVQPPGLLFIRSSPLRLYASGLFIFCIYYFLICILDKFLKSIKQHACICDKWLQMCPTLCDPMNYSPSGFSVHGILHARMVEWLPSPSPGSLPNPGIESTSLTSD